jgi:beta-fructofuranosidase
MFSSQGVSLSDVGDIELFARGDELHLFHLTLPNHDAVQHLVSEDGLSWRRLPAAIRTGDPGDADDDQIWTMSVTEHDGRYYMLYTALSFSEAGRVQRNALATSDDLLHWEKFAGNPVAEADPRWYETAPDTAGMVSWRDPKPVKIGETYHAMVCARENQGPFTRRGAIGVMTSPDMQRWEVHPPLFTPRRWWDLECPQLFTVAGRWYLTAGIMEDRTQRYWIADQPEGPWRVPAYGGVLAPLGHYAGRVCDWRGETIYGCWHQPNPVRPSGEPVNSRVDWARVSNPHGKFIMPPLCLAPRADGSLACQPFSGWQHHTGEFAPLVPGNRTVNFELPLSEWAVETPAGALEIAQSRDAFGDFLLEGQLALDAVSGGFVLRSDDTGAGYHIVITPGSDRVRLIKWLPTIDRHDQRPWFAYTTIQEGRVIGDLDWHADVDFRLLAAGPYIELTLAGEIVLAALSGEIQHGRLGFWAESGALRVTIPRIADVQHPAQPR